jgi:hypothetical protein
MKGFENLIAKLEKANAPSRMLDAMIVVALNLRPDWCGGKGEIWIDDDSAFVPPTIRLNQLGGRNSKGNPPIGAYSEYTASLDAALTLMPEAASFEITRSAAGPPSFTRVRLWDWRRSPTMSDPGNEWKAEGNRPLAINVCIAALKMYASNFTPAVAD